MTGAGFLSNTPLPLGHVTYVVDPEKLKALAGRDWEFIFSPLKDPLYVTLIVVTLIAVVAIFAACELVPWLRATCRRFHDRLLTHSQYVGMTLRLSLGAALIVSGISDAIYLPNVPAGGLGGVEVVLGFCLVAGLMVRLSAIWALVLFVYGLSQSHYLLGTLESLAAAILVILHGPTEPSADDVLDVDPLGTAFEPVFEKLRDLTPVILRLALGTTLIWLAVTEKFLNPRVSEAVVIDFGLQEWIPVTSAMWVFSVGVIELAVGLVLVLGLYTRAFSLIALLVLSLSFFYFNEEVAGHVTFFGSLVVLMVTGAGRYSVDATVARVTRKVRGTSVPYVSEGG